MGTTSVRFVIILVLVVVGVVVITQFPDSSGGAVAARGSGTPTPAATPSTSGGGSTSESTTNDTQQEDAAQVKGVRLAVYNGTLETGLAAAAVEDLTGKQYGYKINPATSILDAENKPVEQTTLYYVSPADKIEAEALDDSYFKSLDVKVTKLPADSTVPKGVQVAVYLGTDYAQTH